MSEFNAQTWVDRAWARHHKRTKGKAPAKKLLEAKKITTDLDAIKGIESVVGWCNFRRIRVTFTTKTTGVYDPMVREIRINPKQTAEKQLYILLHECGHLLIDDKSETTELRFKNGYYVNDERVKKKFIYRCTVLEEEFEAWHRGRKLATKLGVKINDETFNTLKAKFLKSYMLWAVGDPQYQQGGPT